MGSILDKPIDAFEGSIVDDEVRRRERDARVMRSVERARAYQSIWDRQQRQRVLKTAAENVRKERVRAAVQKVKGADARARWMVLDRLSEAISATGPKKVSGKAILKALKGKKGAKKSGNGFMRRAFSFAPPPILPKQAPVKRPVVSSRSPFYQEHSQEPSFLGRGGVL